jgi:hypothetical protein
VEAKTFDKQAAQGDILVTRVDSIPEEGLVKQKGTNGNHIVAHSETGHHHVVAERAVDLYQSSNDEFVMWLVVKEPTSLDHHRSFDTHAPISLDPGNYRINRQREYTPEGFRKVQD